MKKIYTPENDMLFSIRHNDSFDLFTPGSAPGYRMIFIPAGNGIFHADFNTFPFEGPTLLFSTPFQQLYLEQDLKSAYTIAQFHGDFYCIEYHKAQVSCNGLLFNNIYIEPAIQLTTEEMHFYHRILDEMEQEIDAPRPDEIVLRSYLQLCLAKASSIKLRSLAENTPVSPRDELMERFRQLLEENYVELHKPNDYARLLSMTPDNLTKRSVRYFKRSPSQLIQERLILEAKKKLHLTRQSIKEIAYSLNFADEYYFSRFFKRFTKVSPKGFRDQAGISIVADMEDEG